MTNTDDSLYEALAEALDRLPNGFPRTPSALEIPLLKKIFSPEEAQVAGVMGRDAESGEAIGRRVGLSANSARKRLADMARRGLVWVSKGKGGLAFRLAPFIVGIFEAQGGAMDHELAHLMDAYMADGGSAGIMGPQPAVHRVVAAQGAVKSEWILPYDDVKGFLLNSKAFAASDCICRVQEDRLGRRKCAFPLHNCMSFSAVERPRRDGDIGLEEALALLDETEELGLVHTVSNVAEGVFYICNCCGCCCAILRGITELGIKGSVAKANYRAGIDTSLCTGCGACIERCQIGAIGNEGGEVVIHRDRCIGCGLCVSGCAASAVSLAKRPDAEILHPPADFAAWERERLKNRGLA